MKNKMTVLTLLLLLAATAKLSAQVDPHFSQYYAYPLWLNPALTGVINGDSRVAVNYKNQWQSINHAYQTGAVSADFRTTDKMSLGITMLDQSAGDGSYNYYSAYGSFGYAIPVSADGNQKVSFGLQAGIINRSFDMSKLEFGDQYNPIFGFDPTTPSFENFASTSNTIFDANAGVFYYDGDPMKTANIFGGVAVDHLSRPKDYFSANGSSKIPLRYVVHAGVRIKASDMFDIIPNALYIRQQNADIRALGAYSEIKTQTGNGLILGAMYRFGDAAVADVGYHINNMIIGASYDFNTSSLTRATSGQGGFELSFSYVFHKRIQEPEPICPRL